MSSQFVFGRFAHDPDWPTRAAGLDYVGGAESIIQTERQTDCEATLCGASAAAATLPQPGPLLCTEDTQQLDMPALTDIWRRWPSGAASPAPDWLPRLEASRQHRQKIEGELSLEDFRVGVVRNRGARLSTAWVKGPLASVCWGPHCGPQSGPHKGGHCWGPAHNVVIPGFWRNQ